MRAVFKLPAVSAGLLPSLGGRRNPRAARRARKPMQDNWVKAARGRWLKCTYERCGFEWEYFGGRSWAECPTCHTTSKVAVALRNFRQNASFRQSASE